MKYDTDVEKTANHKWAHVSNDAVVANNTDAMNSVFSYLLKPQPNMLLYYKHWIKIMCKNANFGKQIEINLCTKTW